MTLMHKSKECISFTIPNDKQVLTGLEWPCSSVVEPTLGGSTITS
jgi:hypothetical protein